MRYAKKILLTGGGTGGSVTPLLALAEELSLPDQGGEGARYEFLWLGTKRGIEKEMVEKEGIEFRPIHGGKLRRYFDWRNFVDPFLIAAGFFESLGIILKWKPDLIISAGAFVSVPVVLAGWLCRVPVLIHQQDARPGLANKLAAPFAKVVTVTFEKSLVDYGQKAVWTGNPIRPSLKIKYKKEKIKNNLESGLPTVLILGGGTGAEAINKLIEKSLEELTKFCNIIHITGKDKRYELRVMRYESHEFLNVDELAQAYAQADLVISRAGMGVLTELAYLGKPAIIIPIPDSHQEDNAVIFAEADAALVLDQRIINPEIFVSMIKDLFRNKEKITELSANISKITKKGASEEIIKLIKEIK